MIASSEAIVASPSVLPSVVATGCSVPVTEGCSTAAVCSGDAVVVADCSGRAVADGVAVAAGSEVVETVGRLVATGTVSWGGAGVAIATDATGVGVVFVTLVHPTSNIRSSPSVGAVLWCR